MVVIAGLSLSSGDGSGRLVVAIRVSGTLEVVIAGWSLLNGSGPLYVVESGG